PTATQTPTPSPTTTTPPPPGSVGVSQADFFFTPSTVRVGTGQKVTVANISADSRSEEHTSELQSLTNLVCRLLLEKKKDDDLRDDGLDRVSGDREADAVAAARVALDLRVRADDESGAVEQRSARDAVVERAPSVAR